MTTALTVIGVLAALYFAVRWTARYYFPPDAWADARRYGLKIVSVPAPSQTKNDKEILMRILALAILTIATVSAAPSARAQTYDPAYPVCLQIYQGWNDYYFECAYTSLPQCNASASGRAAQCIVNPYYAGAKASPGRRDRRHRRVY
jgi:uncharacterized protein DUF3551